MLCYPANLRDGPPASFRLRNPHEQLNREAVAQVKLAPRGRAARNFFASA